MAFNSADIGAFKNVWVFCEQRQGVMMPTTFELISEGRKLADELGVELCGILLGDTLFTGRELAKGMNEGDLGTVSSPNARGDELVATVKERIPGTTTTQAQQLVANAYADMQLYYANDNNWSNYIGWYADADGNYVGFWDKDSGYENAPAGAVYANKSYGYLGSAFGRYRSCYRTGAFHQEGWLIFIYI